MNAMQEMSPPPAALNMDADSPRITFNLQALIRRYEGCRYMRSRLLTHLEHLPILLEAEHARYLERAARHAKLRSEKDSFRKEFMETYQYYYVPTSDTFYEYDGTYYRSVPEDEIHYKLLTTIHRHSEDLRHCKHQTKTAMLRQIKEHCLLLNSIPNSATIQLVLKLLAPTFPSKQELKYFLTVIGDGLLRKQTTPLSGADGDASPLFFLTPPMKQLLRHIDRLAQQVLGVTVRGNFITKYHDSHDLNRYRIIASLNTADDHAMLVAICQLRVEVMCVAAHYSHRYGNSNRYLESYMDAPLRAKITYFTHTPPAAIISGFIDTCIHVEAAAAPTSFVTWKQLHYIWKQYLRDLGIPSVIYTQPLKEELVRRLLPDTDVPAEGEALVFKGVQSRYGQSVSAFVSFWNQYVSVIAISRPSSEKDLRSCASLENVVGESESESESVRNGAAPASEGGTGLGAARRKESLFQPPSAQPSLCEYEVDELVGLYKRANPAAYASHPLDDRAVLDILRHFFDAQVEVLDDKFVRPITCSLWPKTVDIDAFLQREPAARIAAACAQNEDRTSMVDQLYGAYTQHMQHLQETSAEAGDGAGAAASFPMVVSKEYFENYMRALGVMEPTWHPTSPRVDSRAETRVDSRAEMDCDA